MQKRRPTNGVAKRRDSVLPPEFETAALQRAYHRQTFAIEVGDALAIVEYSRSQWRRFDEGIYPIRKRVFSAKIQVDSALAGKLELIEIDVDEAVQNDEFFWAMDIDTAIEAELGLVMCAAWEDIGLDIAGYGTIIDFRTAWMAPKASRGAIWAAAAKQIIAAEMSKYAIMVMKAFPLEYVADVTPENRYFFVARQKAMIRYYGRLFGVTPFPGASGREGWLYAIAPRLSRVIRAPGPKRMVRRSKLIL